MATTKSSSPKVKSAATKTPNSGTTKSKPAVKLAAKVLSSPKPKTKGSTSKSAASTAGKVLSSPKSTKAQKSVAASALAQRQVKPPAKKGTVSAAAIKRAVAKVSTNRKS